MPTHSANPGRRVVFMVFPGTKLLDVAGPLQVFQDARTSDGEPAYDVTLASVPGGPIKTDTCVTLETAPLASLSGSPSDTVLVSGGAAAMQAAGNKSLQLCLNKLAVNARRIGSICTGAFILAAGGHLKGRKATTHWMHCRELGEENHGVAVDPDAIFVVDGPVWTSAGVSCGIDMTLAMVEADLGRKEALRLARVLVLYLKRPGGQSQFSAPLKQQLSLSTGSLDELLVWIEDNLADRLSVEQLAERANMSNRNFARVFRKMVGLPPATYVEERRVEKACRFLENDQLSVKEVSSLAGFGSEETFRRSFLKIKGVPPSAYAVRFGEK
ncbi:GlxA family transcriptional regulator [Roseibium sp. SCP14]|uniref:GlxA family transcriptional regulator n=1 Tax=Roseibium sp. SCP14 TaxID=3141375 RepID=UPI003337C8CF